MVLKQFPKVLNNQLRCTGVTVLSQSLVDTKDVNEFVSQIVFRAVSAVQGDGWSNGDGRHWEHLENNPFGTVLFVHSDENQVLGWDAAEPFTDVSWVEFSLSPFGIVLFLEGRWFVQDNFSLGRTAMHADLSLGARCDLFDLFDDLREFR